MQQLATSPEDFDLTAVVPPGLEEVAAAELVALGPEAVRPLRRAVACRTDLAGWFVTCSCWPACPSASDASSIASLPRSADPAGGVQNSTGLDYLANAEDQLSGRRERR